MSDSTQAVLLNAVPLLVLAAAYAVVTGALLPALWRDRRGAHLLDWAVAFVFPGIAAAAVIFGVLVAAAKRPLGGHVWVALVAILFALAPALVLLTRFGDRAVVAGRVGRSLAADERVSARDRELEAVSEISRVLGRATDPVEAARPLVQRVTSLLDVGFGGVVLVSESGDEAIGVYGELGGKPARFWGELRMELRTQPSGIASAVFGAAPVTIYDVESSPLLSPQLVELVGAKSGSWIPMIAEERVIGVLVVASTDERRTFGSEDLALLEAVAGEAALALGRLSSADALRAALAESELRLEQRGALLNAAKAVTSELDIETVLRRLVEEVTKLLNADAADCYLLDADRGLLRCAAVHGLDPNLIGFEFTPEHGIAASSLQQARPVSADEYDAIASPVPNPAYDGFVRALVAPMIWGGEARGVLGVGLRDEERTFSNADIELLETFASLASLALRNAETYEERTRQARVQRGFYRIASLLGEPLSLQETYDAAALAAAEALGGDFAAVLVEGAHGLTVVGGHALPDAVRALTLPQALVEASIDGHVLAAARVAGDDRFDAAWQAGPFASLLAIPVPGEGAGLVLVFFEDERQLSRDDLELAQQVAGAARGALDRSRLFEAERTARSLSQQLARTGSLLATELDPEAVLEAVVEEAVGLLRVDAAALSAFEDDHLVVTAAVGDGAEGAIGRRSPSSGWAGGDVVQSRAPVVLPDTQLDESLAQSDSLLAAGHRAYLGVPLTAHEGTLHGVLAVYSREARAWREEEIQALVALAANASIALSNAELYQRVAVEREQSVAILANIADGIVAVDREGNVVLWNRAAEEITGVPASEAIGNTPAQVLQRELESNSGPANRLVAIPRGGEDLWLSLSEAVMRDPTGAVAGRIFAFRDISAEHAVEQMKSDFVSTVSVELRTPLTSIYGFAQTLLREDISFGELERRTFLDFIARESERLTAIVDALLNVAQLDTGALSVSLATTDVSKVLGEVVSNAEAAMNGAGHRFVAELESGSLQARADPEKLRQVLGQLLSNAVKYSPPGGTVTVSARGNGDSVEIAVSDEGAGVPPAERERIFSKFYRAGDAQGRGTGLGLFIAQGLVREMGGRMWVDSQEGKGSRFAFELPSAPAV